MSTETGTPVQYFKWNKKGYWDILPAVISKVNESEVSLIIIGKKTNQEVKKGRHADFRLKGKDHWDFLPNYQGGQYRNILYP